MFNQITKIIFAAILIVSIGSCEKKCTSVVCPVGEECSSGYCVCNDGYEGSDCQTLSYLKYAGNYNASEICNGGPPNFSPYNVSVYGDPNSGVNVIYINGVFSQVTLRAYIYNTPGNLGNNIYVPAQSQGGIYIQDSYGNFYPSSNGSYPYMRINLNYQYGGLAYGCTETFNK